jgi:hypothetical protein
MSFSDKANVIRKSLGKFTKNSIVHEEITRLSQPTTDGYVEAQKMPWLSFLLMEWLYQVDEIPHAKNANSKDVYKILNSMYQLQNDASNFKEGVSYKLALRRMLLGQLWCQRNPLYHQFTIVRLYSLMIISGKTPYFEKTFKTITGIELFDFFQLSLWLSIATVEQKGIIKYEHIVNNFCPQYSVEYISNIIKLICAGPAKMQQVMQTVAKPEISPERYFAQPKLLEVPFFKFEDRLGSLHHSVSCKGLAEFVLNTFKQEDHIKFRKHFSRHFEEYVGVVLDEAKEAYIDENAIKRIYKANKQEGKVIDYLILKDESSVFIDAKAIEPAAKVMVTDDAEIIRQRLKGSFIKGIEQSFECAKILTCCKEVSLATRANRFVLVVTHQDFYLSNGVSLKEQISADFFTSLIDKYGDYIPVENVHFCSIEDFEGIMMIYSKHEIELTEFLRFCTEQDSQAATKKFDIRQHLQSFFTSKGIDKNSPIGSNYLLKRKDELFGSLTKTLNANHDYWKKIGEEGIPQYLSFYGQFCKLIKS